jgi:hypothetical protein
MPRSPLSALQVRKSIYEPLVVAPSRAKLYELFSRVILNLYTAHGVVAHDRSCILASDVVSIESNRCRIQKDVSLSENILDLNGIITISARDQQATCAGLLGKSHRRIKTSIIGD